LPNGFHDARVSACTIDFVGRKVAFELQVWMGDETDRERYRPARLSVTGLAYCATDAPDPRYPFADRVPLVVDLCDADPAVRANAAIPPDAFSARFWVAGWNAFIHLAGTDAQLTWADRSQPERLFLNVDLDIDSAEDLSLLITALEPRAYSLARSAGRASFELSEPVQPTTPEPLILEFVRLVKGLPPQVRALWDRADRRVFDIGIQSGRGPFQEGHRLAPDTLRAAAEVEAEVAFTVYSLAESAPERTG